MLTNEEIISIKERRSSILKINNDVSLTVEEQAIFYIYEDLENVKKNFVDIAFRLNEANNYKYYEKFGYESIVDFAEHLFGFRKSSTYSLMSIAQRFCSGMKLLPKYEKFSQSQLTEMCALPEYLLENVTSDMTIQDIRDYKKAYNNLTVIDNTYKQPKVLIEQYRTAKSTNLETEEISEEENSRCLEEDVEWQPTKKELEFLNRLDKLKELFDDIKYFQKKVYDKVKYYYMDNCYELKICGTERNIGFLIHSILNTTFGEINKIIKE